MKRLVALFLITIFASSPAFAAVRFDDGSKTITTAGTPLALTSTSTDATTLIVCGDTANTGKICVGGSPLCTAGAQQGIVLAAGSCAPIYVAGKGTIDISTVKCDVTVNGEECAYFWMNDAL